MADILPVIVVSPLSAYFIVSVIKFCIAQYNLHKNIKLLLKNGVQHGLVTHDQIVF